MAEAARFLLVNDSHDSYYDLLVQVLAPLGSLTAGGEQGVVGLMRDHTYDLVIIDASAVEHVPPLIDLVRVRQPCARIIVVTASPTWTRAREAFLAGATDYTHKTLDPNELDSMIRGALGKPVPDGP